MKVGQKWEPLYDFDMAKLKPAGPPGRANRKARAFTTEIVELHQLGYTLEAIKQALEGAGVHVCRMTVHRELRRGQTEGVRSRMKSKPKKPGTSEPVVGEQVLDSVEPTTTVRARKAVPVAKGSSMEKAEEFARSHSGNPLLKGKVGRK
jgi:hypothetical protein